GRERLLNTVLGSARLTGDAGDLRIALGKDVQPPVAAQAELNRDGAAGIDHVEGRRVVDGREEAVEGVEDIDERVVLGGQACCDAGRLHADGVDGGGGQAGRIEGCGLSRRLERAVIVEIPGVGQLAAGRVRAGGGDIDG